MRLSLWRRMFSLINMISMSLLLEPGKLLETLKPALRVNYIIRWNLLKLETS